MTGLQWLSRPLFQKCLLKNSRNVVSQTGVVSVCNCNGVGAGQMGKAAGNLDGLLLKNILVHRYFPSCDPCFLT